MSELRDLCMHMFEEKRMLVHASMQRSTVMLGEREYMLSELNHLHMHIYKKEASPQYLQKLVVFLFCICKGTRRDILPLSCSPGIGWADHIFLVRARNIARALWDTFDMREEGIHIDGDWEEFITSL